MAPWRDRFGAGRKLAEARADVDFMPSPDEDFVFLLFVAASSVRSDPRLRRSSVFVGRVVEPPGIARWSQYS